MLEITENFESHDFPVLPRFIGVIDGTHIRIQAPTVNPNAYINRKKFNSLVTQVSVIFSCDQQMNYWYAAIINDALTNVQYTGWSPALNILQNGLELHHYPKSCIPLV